MKETVKVCLERSCVRAYKAKPVSKEYLNPIVSCGQYAASDDAPTAAMDPIPRRDGTASDLR